MPLAQILLKARDTNPEIRQARQMWKVQSAQVAPARTWPDPTFTYIDEKFPSGVEGVEPMHMRHYRLEQMIPFPGKLSNDARMKYHEALIAESGYRAKTLEVLNDTRMRYYQLYLTDQKIALASESVSAMQSALKTAQSRLASNQSSASDVFMAQTELRQMENDLLEQKQQRTLIEIELNTLMNQPTDTAWGTVQAPDLVELPISLADLQTLAQRNDPQYQTAMHEVNHSKAMLRHHRLSFAPDFGLMYEHETADSGPAGRQIGLSVSFPLWFWKPWKLSESAAEHIKEAESTAQSMKNMVKKSVHTEFVQVQTHWMLTRNYQAGILPSALANLHVARDQYAGGQGDFLRLLEAFRTWINTHNAYQEHLYAYGEHWSALGRWVGIDLTQAKEALEQNKLMPMEKKPHE